MRYIGGKSLLTTFINDAIEEHTQGVKTIFDIFSGTGSVAMSFKKKGYLTKSNDFLYFSYVLQQAHIVLNDKPAFAKLGIANPIEYLNNLSTSNANLSDCFMYRNYAPTGDCKRMYFQPQNALKIDVIRQQIELWYSSKQIDDNEYFYLLASLIEAVPYVANITGVYAAYLKFWDKRTYNDLNLEEPEIIPGNKQCLCFNEDYLKVLSEECDLLYADPPYNSREYLPNYHILETIARYDYPAIHGISGMRDYEEQKSPFCKKREVHKAFEDLIDKSNARYILISYNNEGLIPQDDLEQICQERAKTGTFQLIEMDYRRYKSKIPNNKAGLREQLYFLERK